MSLNEKQLITRLRDPKHRQAAYSDLLDAYQERVYWHVRKMVIDHDDANDLTQDIFIKVWKNLDGFKEESRLFTWIYRIATNECLNHLKKMQRRQMQSIDDQPEMVSAIDHGHLISGDEIEKKLQKALLQLPDKQRLVFNMRYYDEMKFQEIAEVTGTSEGALKASYHHAVKKIEQYLNTD